uniref:Uncharacterized protein n=1 Tax=Steinernema glaseri TaxID=37863 RepID=A0A1I7ZVI8_9BILA
MLTAMNHLVKLFFLLVSIGGLSGKTLDVPAGCFTDRWVQAVEKCIGIPHLVDLTSIHCQQTIHAFNAKGNCRRGYALDIEFTCCQARNYTDQPKNIALQLQPHFARILKEIYANKKNLDRLLAETTEATNEIRRDLGFTAKWNKGFDVATRDHYADMMRDLLKESFRGMEKKLFRIDTRRTELIYENMSAIVLLTSRNQMWEKKKAQLEERMWDSMDSLFRVLLQIMFGGEIYNSSGDFLSPGDIKSDCGHFPELRTKIDNFWRENFMLHLWGIPKDELDKLSRMDNVTAATLTYYKENIEAMLSEDVIVIECSGGPELLDSIFMVSVGCLLVLVVLKVFGYKVVLDEDEPESGRPSVIYVCHKRL